MHLIRGVVLLSVLSAVCAFAQKPITASPGVASLPTCTLTIHVDGVNQQGGNVGVLVFQNDKGWPEDRLASFKDVRQPAHAGTVTIKVPDLPPGDYAIAVGHDANLNRKVDKNWFGKPTEQWGMSNNPHATVKAPPFNKAKIVVNADSEIHIQLQ